MFYRIIEALFITHAQTKLNILGHLDGIVVENINMHLAKAYAVDNHTNWYQNLVRRPTELHGKRTIKSHRMNPHYQ